jgi:hypothetical protein
MSDDRRFSHDFHCVWHLLENYGSNKWFATFVRRIAFATCEVDFLEQMSRIFDDLTVLAEHDKLNQRCSIGFPRNSESSVKAGRFASIKYEQRSGNLCGFGQRMGEQRRARLIRSESIGKRILSAIDHPTCSAKWPWEPCC